MFVHLDISDYLTVQQKLNLAPHIEQYGPYTALISGVEIQFYYNEIKARIRPHTVKKRSCK